MKANYTQSLALFEKMVLIREVERSIADNYANGKMRCPTHLSIGQEAVSAAFSQLSNINDYAVSTHRGHAHFLAKGGNLNSMIAEIYGKSTGCSIGKGGSMHLIDLNVNFMGTSAIVGNSIPLGVGLAYALMLQKSEHLSYIFLGDGATEEGVFYESLNFAVLKNLPVVFVCENNFYSVYSPLTVRQPPSRSISALANEIGANIVVGNGNNVRESFDKLQLAISSAKNDAKPVFLEFFTYRHREHCGPNFDDHLEYRPKDEIQHWTENDPIEEHRKFMINQFATEPIIFDNVYTSIRSKINDAFDFAESSPPPSPDTAYKHIYASNS
ncbi:thiamine pyrophosphate-dependent dehydrogenase E1 component subunit alpha [Synechococcus sp. MIT S9451]|uniref:thiamine pyrophosphate-dependent dehydrogenase E1 component subunit alpha n=1 Tax=Synechococcus sp. MIT S9451 TaxID=3082543 RepID=UPI0039B6B7AA